MIATDFSQSPFCQQLSDRLSPLVQRLYPDHDQSALLQKICDVASPHARDGSTVTEKWDEQTLFLITYGDSLLNQATGEAPLQTLAEFLEQHLRDVLSVVHILPFFPYSSDDGFSVIDYRQVNPRLGDWQDIERIAQTFDVMSDLVINHVSSQSEWFQQFIQQQLPGRDYFITCDPETDCSAVVRPRSTPLLTRVQTVKGLQHVWTTFSPDQVDLDFRNPAVLLEFIDIVLDYCHYGARFIRLDAVGFLWKQLGTSCMHLPQTHAAIRLIREVLAMTYSRAAIVTETNVPNRENLSYFGNRNEAHMIYNFSLPPLLLNALIRGEAQHLKTWIMSMPPAPEGCAYFNFTASHDGIGMRPAEGLLADTELAELFDTMQQFGGKISYRRHGDGRQTPYEINISLFDALQGTLKGPDQWQRQRFLCSQLVMLSLEGIPAFYIHSLLATSNDYNRVQQTGQNRSINRHQWDYELLQQKLADPASDQAWIFGQLKKLIQIRREQSAFHPNATQYTLHLHHPAILGMWRQSRDRAQSIFCLHNLSDAPQSLLLSEINLICTDEWHDLLSGEKFSEDCTTIELAPYQTVWITNSGGENLC
ncbi:alpha-amylase [filamentous cyanobacterium LEGE 11480]|uniref:Alpha-amylase n=1 Tax=Romeriopsis navalis LEGE 11480 TaxID=2777977 RepID=A0A928VP64_9CYAN|nr:sugar phosphorylase [Romeriopsis navalis]MBE9030085.1 alpha-amylase [Romeriopsis navalis LEGE 11480]